MVIYTTAESWSANTREILDLWKGYSCQRRAGCTQVVFEEASLRDIPLVAIAAAALRAIATTSTRFVRMRFRAAAYELGLTLARQLAVTLRV